MKSFTLKVSLAVSLLALISLVGALPTKSDSARAQLDHSQGQARQHRALPAAQTPTLSRPAARAVPAYIPPRLPRAGHSSSVSVRVFGFLCCRRRGGWGWGLVAAPGS